MSVNFGLPGELTDVQVSSREQTTTQALNLCSCSLVLPASHVQYCWLLNLKETNVGSKTGYWFLFSPGTYPQTEFCILKIQSVYCKNILLSNVVQMVQISSVQFLSVVHCSPVKSISVLLLISVGAGSSHSLVIVNLVLCRL